MTVRFVKHSVTPFGLAPSSEARALQTVELCGRTAYKSEDKITETSAKSFVLMLKSHGHLSVLEHSNVVLKVDAAQAGVPFVAALAALKDRLPFHKIYPLGGDAGGGFLIAGNFRSWIETLAFLNRSGPALAELFGGCLRRFFPSLFGTEAGGGGGAAGAVSLVGEEEQLERLKAEESADLPVFIFKFICDRGITHEVVRHRVFSYTQESTRYVNYKSKGMALILPEELYPFYDDRGEELSDDGPAALAWLARAESLFDWYVEDLARGLRPEIARDILPNLLKSEIFVSGRFSGWTHFVRLRESKAAHPRIRFLAREVRKYFDSMGLPIGPPIGE